MSLISVSLTLFPSPGIWDKFYLDCILGKGDELFKCIGQFRFLGIEDLPQELLTENFSMTVEFLDNKTAEITAGAYLLSFSEFVKSV